jgi:alanine racemase
MVKATAYGHGALAVAKARRMKAAAFSVATSRRPSGAPSWD